MKDLYKRIGIEPGASDAQVGRALASPAVTLAPETHEAARYVLTEPGRRAVYDRTHRVLSTVGELRSHLGLNYKPFWARGGMKDFTRDLAAARRPRRSLRSIRPADLARAFGLTGRDQAARDIERGRRRMFVTAAVLLAAGVLAAGYIGWTLYTSR